MANNYNINEMRSVLIAARNKGNKRPISESFAKDCGVSATYFKAYIADMDKLYTAVAAYCRLKNSPRQDDAGLAEKFEEVRASWQKFTECGEATEFSRELRISEHDVSNLVGFCQGFMQDSNNVNFEEKFVAKRVWAVNTFQQFQKFVETDMGIRIANVEVLTDEERDFLTKENHALSTIASITAVIKEAEDKLSRLNAAATNAKSDELKAYLKAEIDKLSADVDTARENLRNAQNALADLYADDTEVEVPEEVAKAESEAKEEG